MAARFGKAETLTLLWDCNIHREDMKATTKEDWTPLHVAARLEYFSEYTKQCKKLTNLIVMVRQAAPR